MPVLLSSPPQARSTTLPAGMTTPSPTPDPFGPAFLDRLRAGDREAFEAMAEAFYERLVRYAYGYVRDLPGAEDVVQDTLFHIWMSRENLVIRTALASYLFSAVRNRALNYTRHQRAEVRRADRLSSSEPDEAWLTSLVSPATPWDDDNVVFETRIAAVYEAIAALPRRQAEAFELRIQHGMSFAEVAEVMEVSLRTAETTYMRAVKFLRERLAPYMA